MDRGPARSVLREIETLYALGTLSGLTDAQLLERFVARNGDEAGAAFAALMHRHGPTILGVCRRMLPASHDAEDAFQATFLVLARRAASIGRRERLASWLYGVAVRTAKETRRRAARERAISRRLMDVPTVESEPPEDLNEVLPLLDEELSRLPERYRAALIACELEGKSRREAAEQLGIPEGTLSTHLARGRKLLRERLLRRGVSLGAGPIAALSRPLVESAVPERLLGPTIQAALGSLAAKGAAATVSVKVSSLAERVLKMMFLARLALIVAVLLSAAGSVAAVVLGLSTVAAVPAPPDPPRAGPDDLAGRVVDKNGAGVAGVPVWAMDGDWITPATVVMATTDANGRYVVPWSRKSRAQRGNSEFRVFARSRDGRVGWWQPDELGRGNRPEGEIELAAVGDARGRLVDQNGQPVAGVEVTAAAMGRPGADLVGLGPQVMALFRATTAADGSFVLKGIPQGDQLQATVAAPKFASPRVAWDATEAVVITLDSRLGRIKGRLQPLAGRGLDRSFPIKLRNARPDTESPPPFVVHTLRDTATAPDGTFELDALPPDRYVIYADFNQDGIIASRFMTAVDLGPGGAATVEIPLRRAPVIGGRIVDARTGRGVAGVRLSARVREEQAKHANWYGGDVTTDADGRYSIPARAGEITLSVNDVPPAYLVPYYNQGPTQRVDTDWTAPDVKLAPATECEGVVVDTARHPVPSAEVYFLTADRTGVDWRFDPLRTGPDGAFRVDRLDPDQFVAFWARAGDAATGEPVVVRPGEDKGKITLTIDPKNTVRLRGLAVDSGGNRIAGATVTLRWQRGYPVEKGHYRVRTATGVLATATTGSDGSFVFRNLWPEVAYTVVLEARGHNKAETPELTGKAGQTHDVGKIVLIDTSGYLAGRVVGSDGRPIAGAGVFNRGDGPETVATSTDANGRFRLDGMFAGPKYAFVRAPGYRFTGIRVDSNADGLTITLRKTDEPPPAWQPGTSPGLDDQRAFARQILIRVWEKYGKDRDLAIALDCIQSMAGIDPDLARQWSAAKPFLRDRVRRAEARHLADTDPTRALALLNQKPDTKSQAVVQALADRFAETDAPKALRFAEEAALQSRGLDQPNRAVAMAKAGAVLVKLGRADAGRKLIDEAARDAAGLPTAPWASNFRSDVARMVASFDADRALAIIEPFRKEDPVRWSSLRADIAIAIATTDTKRALVLADALDDGNSDRERARTAIACRIARDRPDEAVRIIEGIDRGHWQAKALGRLAVALAPRDQDRANALIDRALATMVNHWNWINLSPGDEMPVAARVAACARRIGYPDMHGAIMRVLAARQGESGGRLAARGLEIQLMLEAAVTLALIDPAAARAVLDQVEAGGGLDPMTLWSTDAQWLMAWSLVDLEKARTIFEARLATIGNKDVGVWTQGFFETVELLTAPPERRESVVARRSGGGYWHPDEEP